MPTTDRRVVQMEFDNRDFERGITQSQESLEKFKDELDFDAQEENLRHFQNVARQFSLEGISENLQKLTDKFTGLGTVSELVLSQIRREIEKVAAKISSFAQSMTTAQISVGMDKFEMLNKSVQTIKAATGETEEKVYSVMKRLNQYTDQTSYNFADMAQNIGKFTSVGIDLESAERQMEGIANWAARSGAGISEASRAMYNLSQAMGAGSLKLIDWKSIENAGMATKEFKEQLINAGIAMGTLEVTYGKNGERIVKTARKLGSQTEVNYKNISSTFVKGWATNDVVGKTLEGYYYEDLYYEGQVASLIETTKEQREELKTLLQDNGTLTTEDLEKVGLSEEEVTKKAWEAAVAQKKIAKEINDEGEEVYYMLDKNGKKTKTIIDSIESMIKNKLFDASLAESVFGLNKDPMLDATEKQLEAVRTALGENDTILKKNWLETMAEQGLATDEVKKAAMDAAVAVGNLEKVTTKDGRVIYKTARKYGQQMEVTLDNFEDMLRYKWFTTDVADTVWKINDLGKASYESAQKCLTFNDVLGAWRDQISTGWMQSFQHIFGNLTESMKLFSTICNKVSDAVGDLIDTRNAVLEIWGDNGGRSALWGMLIGEYQDGEDTMFEGAFGLLDGFLKIGDMLKEGFWGMIKKMIPTDGFEAIMGTDWFRKNFPDFSGTFDEFWELDGAKEAGLAALLMRATTNVQNFIQSVHDFFNEIPEGATKSRIEMLQDVVNGIFSGISFIWTIIRKIAGFLGQIGEKLKPSVDKVLSLFSKLGLGIQDAADGAAHGTGLTNFFGNLLEAITPLADAINNIIGTITDLIGRFIEGGQESGAFANILKFIGDMITTVAGVISRVVGPIVTFISDLMNIIGMLFQDGITEESMKKAGAMLEEAFSNLFDGVFSAFGEDLGKQIKDFFAYIFGFVEDETDDGAESEAKTLVGALKKWFRKIFGVVGELFEGFKSNEGEFTLFRLIKENLGLNVITKFFRGITDIFSGSNIFVITKAVGVMMILWKAFGMFSKGKAALESARGFFSGLKDALNKDFNSDITDKTESVGERLLQIAKGLSLIAAAVAILGSMEIGSLAKGVITVGLIMAAMWGFMVLMKRVMTGMGLGEMISLVASIGLIGLAVTAMAASMAILILALTPLANMNIVQIMNMLTGFLGVIVMLGLFGKYISKEFIGVKVSEIFNIALLAIGIGILINALLKVKNVRIDQLITMLAAFGGVLGILYVYAKFMQDTSFSGTGLWSVIGLALGVAILMRSLKTVSDTPFDKIINGLIALGVILGMLTLMSKSFSTFKNTGMFQIIFLAMGVSMLVATLGSLAKMEWGELAKMGVGLAAILIMLTLFNDSMQSMRFTELAGVISLGLGIKLLVSGLMPLAKVEWGDLAKMMVGLLGVLLMVHTFIAGTEGIKFGQATSILISMLGLSAVMAMFGLAMGALKDVAWHQILAACLGLIAVMLVYAAVVELINNNTNAVLKGAHALVAMAGLAALMFVFSIAMNEIKNVKTEKILAFSLGLAALIAAIAVALKVTSTIPIAMALKGILVIGVAMAALIGVLALMMPILLGSIASSLETMAAKLDIIAGMFANFVASMSEFSEEEVRSAMGKLAVFYELLKYMKDVSEYFPVAQAFASCLMELGVGLALFNTLAQGTPDPTKDPGLKFIEAILNKKDKIAAFTVGEFATGMQNLGSGLSAFTENSSTVTTAEPTSWLLLKKFLDNIGAIQRFGRTDFSAATQSIQGLGGALALYAMGVTEIGGVEAAEITESNVAKAVDLMALICSGIAEKGDLTIPNIPKKEDLGTFPSDLAALAGAVVAFAGACETFTYSQTQPAMDALKFLDELHTNLTEDRLKTINVFKDNNVSGDVMGQFALDIRSLGTALLAFYNRTKNLTDMSGAKSALEFFKGLKDDLNKDTLDATKAFDDASVHETELGRFAKDITALGGALQSFATNTHFDSGTSTTFENALTALQTLVKMQNEMPDVGGVVQWWQGHSMSFQELADNVTVMGQGLANLSKALTNVGTDTDGNAIAFNAEVVGSALGSLASIVDIIKSLSLVDESKLKTGYHYAALVAEVMDDLVSGIEVDDNGQITNVGSFVTNLGLLMHAISQEVKEWNETEEPIDNGAIDLFAKMSEAFNNLMSIDPTLDFGSVGYNIAAGVAAGLRLKDSQDVVTEAAREMIRKIKTAAQDEAKVASPSRIFANEVGAYLSLGVAQGINKHADSAEGAAEDMVDDTFVATEGPLARLAALLANGIDTNPTITPVLDLSQVQAGITTLNGMLGNPNSMTLDPSVTAGQARLAIPDAGMAANQNGTDLSSLISQLKTMEAELSKGLEKISRLKIVLDSGTVAGELADKIDDILGDKAYYYERES